MLALLEEDKYDLVLGTNKIFLLKKYSQKINAIFVKIAFL